MPSIEEKTQEKLDYLDKERNKVLAQLNKARASRSFECVCGKNHRIKDCAVIQTHWYTSPHGCTGGDYWSEGELHIVCPEIGHRNRVLFQDIAKVQWDKRKYPDYALEPQFSLKYKNLFANVVDEHDNNSRGINNYYFEKHAKRFGLVRKVN